MATDEEILDVLLQIRATGQAEADAVNEIIARTGNTAAATGVQVGGLTQAHKEHADVLQTLSGYTTTYGGSLTAQEEHYAKLQLSSKEFSTAERDISAEAGAAARAMGALGSEGAHAMDRIAALGGVMGSGGAMGIGIGAALVGTGLLVEMGKSMIDNADQNEAAQRNLAQAFDSQGMYLSVHQADIEAFITKNARYVSSEYDVKNAFAELTRGGLDWTMTSRLMNDALDLSAAKHIDLNTAVTVLMQAHAGNTRALHDLGITSSDVVNVDKELQKAQGEVTKATDEHSKATRTLAEWEAAHSNRSKLTQADLMHEQDLKARVTKSTQDLTAANQDLSGAQAASKSEGDKFNQILDLLEPKITGARKDTSDLKQSQHELGVTWQKMSDDNGPALEGMFSAIVDRGDKMLTWMRDDTGPVFSALDGYIMTNVVDPLNLVKQGFEDVGNAWDGFVRKIGGDPNAAYTVPAGRGGPAGHQMTRPAPAQVTVVVQGSPDPNATARAVTRALRHQLST